ncbi:M60 family metallopeptidase [Enterococcus faecalis]|uniref:M60 family metallopeptidase n=1 Tax=Enterococcus faecalis TaxID=1351 RepID=UPI00136F633D|nr:M60 family metallopeptidase [Enterococcus faecalis]NAA54061.1 LapB repeat-containing protein [Enterococcus faecalis]
MKKKYLLIVLSSIMMVLLFTPIQEVFAETKVIAAPSGNAQQRSNYEMRQFQHSSIEPTGLYVKQGDKLTIQASNVEDAKVFLGHYGDYKDPAIGKQNFKEYDLQNGSNHITMEDQIGQVYIENFSEDKELEVTIKGGRKAPIFHLGKTTDKEFFDALNRYKEAPFFELVGKNVFGIFSMSLNKEIIEQRESVKELVEYWDKVYQLENEAMGLYFGGEEVGVNRKYPNRINIINGFLGEADIYAYQRFVGFAGAAHALLTQKPGEADWGLWHEFGHTYQNPFMLWESDKYKGEYPGYCLTEVTVNINATYVEKKLGITNGRMLENIEKREKIAEYLNATSENKDFDTASIDPEKELTDTDTSAWMKLGMFHQLMWAYGENVFAHVNQEYRLMAYKQERMPKTNEEKRQTFMKILSKVTQRNLTNYFHKWGLYPNDEVKQFMREFEEPQVPIEQNILPGNDKPIVDEELSPISIPTVVPKNFLFKIGMTAADIPQELLFEKDSEKNMPSGERETFEKEVIVKPNYLDESILFLELKNSEGIKNLFDIPVDRSYGNALSFKGYFGKEERAILTLQKETKKIQTVSDPKKTTPIDSGNEQYAEVTIYKNKQLEEVKKVAVNTNDTPFEFAKALSNISYENGYYIKVNMYQEKHLTAYTEGEPTLNQADSEKQEWFKIENDQLVRQSKPAAEFVQKEIQLGTAVSAEELVENITDFLNPEKVTASFVTEPNWAVVGPQNVAVKLTNIGSQEAIVQGEITINYGNALSFKGYLGKEERAVLTLQKETKKIQTVSNPKKTTPIDSENEQYAEVTIYKNKQLEEVKKVAVNTNDTPFEFAKALSNISYENGYYIKVNMYREKHLIAYTEGKPTLNQADSKKQEWFKIENDTLIRVNPTPIIHLKGQSSSVYVGGRIDVDEFVEKIEDEFDPEKVELSFEQLPDTTITGEHKAIILAKNIVGNEVRVPVTYSVIYGNALSLRAYLPSDERLVIRLDNDKREIHTFANPDRDTVLSSGTGLIWQFVLKDGTSGKEKVNLTANKEETPFDFADQLNHTPFKEGDLVELKHTSGGTFVKNFKHNEESEDPLGKENTFVIKAGQFVFVTDEKPTIESLEKVVYEKGQEVTKEQFIKDIKLQTEDGNQITTNFDPTWVEKVGEYKGTVTVENPLNHQKANKEITVCVQDTTPPIITGNKEIDYPVYADVTEQQLFEDLNIRTNEPATLSSNFNRKMLEKEGTYKIEIIAEDSYGNKSEPFLVTLKVVGVNATHTFKKGYWETYGLILNGQVKMLGVDLSKKDSVVKTVELVDESGKVAVSIPTVNTNWYTPGQYDGYQATLSEKTMATVQAGEYTLQINVKVGDSESITVPFVLNETSMFGIQEYHDVFLDIPTNNIGLKTIETMSKEGRAMVKVTTPDKPIMGLISEGQAKEGRFVNGYILNTDFDFSQKHQKNVVIEDKSGKVVKELKNIHTWDLTSWNLGIAGLDMKSGFQVIIPKEYQNTSLYQYKLQVVTGEEETIQLEVALDKII